MYILYWNTCSFKSIFSIVLSYFRSHRPLFIPLSAAFLFVIFFFLRSFDDGFRRSLSLTRQLNTCRSNPNSPAIYSKPKKKIITGMLYVTTTHTYCRLGGPVFKLSFFPALKLLSFEMGHWLTLCMPSNYFRCPTRSTSSNYRYYIFVGYPVCYSSGGQRVLILNGDWLLLRGSSRWGWGTAMSDSRMSYSMHFVLSHPV